MSKLNFSLIGILVIFATLITFSSCNKEAELEATTTNDEVLERILDFKQKVETPNQQKSGEVVSVEDAVWIVEAALNYSYCMTEQSDSLLNEFVLDSLLLDINISNGKMFYNEVVNSYIEMAYEITATLENYEANFKKITLADVECDLENSLLKIYFIVGTKEIEEKSTKFFTYNFGTTDYWYWGWDLGKAPPYTGQGVPLDACDKLATYASYRISRPLGSAYLTDIETIYEEENSSYMWNGSTSGGNEPHLNPSEMNYFLNKLIEVGKVKRPIGKSIVNYRLEESIGLGGGDRFHVAYLKYGIWHVTNPGGCNM